VRRRRTGRLRAALGAAGAIGLLTAGGWLTALIEPQATPHPFTLAPIMAPPPAAPGWVRVRLAGRSR